MVVLRLAAVATETGNTERDRERRYARPYPVSDGGQTFRNRTDAGRQLADLLDDRDVEAEVVLGIPRGRLPVAAPDAVERLLGEADEVIADETPPHFGAVGQFYESFPQVSDEEARSYLEA